LQVQSSLARAVTVDNEVATNSRTLHTLNVVGKRKKAQADKKYRPDKSKFIDGN
jgi:hypothetical protein